MSLNSLQDDMSRRAASMAAMAKRANRPEQIEAIQKSLIAGVQGGSIQPYVGIPLIQELTNKLAEVKAKMAQNVAGAGMPQPPQGGAPIAQQVMQQAAQMDQSQGLEALPSNLPQEYAGGGIIAFEDGGQVERYQSAGYTGESERKRAEEAMAKLRTYGLRQRQQDPQGYIAAEAAAKEAQQALSNIERQITGGPAGLLGQSMGLPTPSAVAPTATPAAMPYDPATATRRSMFEQQAQPPAPPAPPPALGIGGGGGGGFKPPTLQTYTPTIATLPERKMGNLTDLDAITKDMDKKTKAAFGDAVKASQTELESFDKPGFESREGRLGEREAGIEKESAISRALTGIKTGLRIAGSKERTLAGALANEGSQGIEDLIKGEAAKRAAKDRLEDMRDNLEQQKVAAKKGNYQAAQTAGREASRDLQAATQLSLTGAQAGNTQSINMYNALSQSDIGRAGVTNQGQQLQLSAVDQQNRNALGIAGLGLQAQQLAQTGAFQNKQLAAMEQRYAAMDKASQARMAQVRAGAFSKFNEIVAPQLNAQLTSEYGKNWRVGQDPRSLEAQMKFKQAQTSYLMDALGQYDDRISAKDSSEY
jgi:hypothetical protein